MHVDAAAEDQVPIEQARQALADVAPKPAEYKPALQLWQTDEADAPRVDEYVPEVHV